MYYKLKEKSLNTMFRARQGKSANWGAKYRANGVGSNFQKVQEKFRGKTRKPFFVFFIY